MTKSIVLFLTLFLCTAGLGQTITDLRKIFNYDKAENINYKAVSSKDTTQGTITYLTFASTNGFKVTACLIIPRQNLREFPVVIFLNDGSQKKRLFFLTR